MIKKAKINRVRLRFSSSVVHKLLGPSEAPVGLLKQTAGSHPKSSDVVSLGLVLIMYISTNL